jgi:hypothetical protein
VTTSIPKAYQGYVSHAASTLGIPEQLVAEQINLESTWNPRAKSPAGAEGIAQFEPATFAKYGKGSPYNVGDAFAAYENYMGALLKQEKGSIRNALAAYNAGPDDLSAGYTYANMIMQRAGVIPGAKAGPAGHDAAYDPNSVVNQVVDAATGGILSFPTQMLSFFSEGTDALTSTVKFFGAFFQPSTYVRIGAGFFGLALVVAGVVTLGMSVKE